MSTMQDTDAKFLFLHLNLSSSWFSLPQKSKWTYLTLMGKEREKLDTTHQHIFLFPPLPLITRMVAKFTRDRPKYILKTFWWPHHVGSQ